MDFYITGSTGVRDPLLPICTTPLAGFHATLANSPSPGASLDHLNRWRTNTEPFYTTGHAMSGPVDARNLHRPPKQPSRAQVRFLSCMHTTITTFDCQLLLSYVYFFFLGSKLPKHVTAAARPLCGQPTSYPPDPLGAGHRHAPIARQ